MKRIVPNLSSRIIAAQAKILYPIDESYKVGVPMSFSAYDPYPLSRLAELGKRPLSYPRSLVEFAYEQLLSMLVTMKIAPGAHIGIEALARQLQISQTPVREALTVLEAQRLVYKIPNVGFRATDLLTLGDIDALFEIRLMIEPSTAALAARRASDSMLQRLVSLADEMAQATEGNDVAYAHFAEGDAKLHYLIATASGNRFVGETIQGLHVHLHIFRFLFNTNATQKALSEHAVLINALTARDPAASEAAMRTHLIASRRRMDSVTAPRGGAAEARSENASSVKPSAGRGHPRKKLPSGA